jgi:lipopolysaccharide export system protein LptA
LLIQFKIVKIALSLGAIFLFSLSALSQDNLFELLPGAKKIVFNEKTGAHRVIGPLNFVYQGKHMYCDSVHYYEKNDLLFAYGNVHLIKDEVNLYCDSLRYSGITKLAKLWGHVRVRDLEYKVTTDSMDYNSKTNLGIYRNGGRIESLVSGEVLTSKVGYLYIESKNLFFRGNVKLISKEMQIQSDTLRYEYMAKKVYFAGTTEITNENTKLFCEKGWFNVETEEGQLVKNARVEKENNFVWGDTLSYFPKDKIMIGLGHVVFKDTSEKMEFRGNYALVNDSLRYTLLTGDAIYMKRFENQKTHQFDDTLFLHADTLYSLQDSLGKMAKLKAYFGVKMFKNDFQSICDSLSYDQENGKMEMFNNPIVWSKNAELKGDFIEILLSDTLIEKINLIGNSTALMEIDSGKYYNQIGGKVMENYFMNNDLVRSEVRGGAKTVFFPESKEENDSVYTVKRMGMNRIYATDLKVYLDSGEVSRIVYLDKPDGVFYPMNQIKASEQFIDGFKWNAALRPKSFLDILLP